MGPEARPQFRSKLERDYAEHLFGLKRQRAIVDYRHEAVTLRLGFDTRYTPDFMVIPPATVDLGGGFPPLIQFHEVKGRFFREDARVKLYACAAAFQMFRFFLVAREPDGAWKLLEIRT